MIEFRRVNETNAACDQHRRLHLNDACAAHRTRAAPICELCTRPVFHHAAANRRTAAFLSNDYLRRCRRRDRQSAAAQEVSAGIIAALIRLPIALPISRRVVVESLPR